jgi:hypothetical protein
MRSQSFLQETRLSGENGGGGNRTCERFPRVWNPTVAQAPKQFTKWLRGEAETAGATSGADSLPSPRKSLMRTTAPSFDDRRSIRRIIVRSDRSAAVTHHAPEGASLPFDSHRFRRATDPSTSGADLACVLT